MGSSPQDSPMSRWGERTQGMGESQEPWVMASVGEAGRSVWAGGLTGAWGTEGLCTEVLAPQLPHQTKQGLSLPLPPEFSPSGDSSRGLASPGAEALGLPCSQRKAPAGPRPFAPPASHPGGLPLPLSEDFAPRLPTSFSPRPQLQLLFLHVSAKICLLVIKKKIISCLLLCRLCFLHFFLFLFFGVLQGLRRCISYLCPAGHYLSVFKM